ncbi:MAG: adenosyl-hopene transferase HpnH, partial [Candidatus Bipolaricaulia bacterium]
MELNLRLGAYITKNLAQRRKWFPLVTILEPLEACNLSCPGCGRVREYRGIWDRRLSVEESVGAVAESGAPVVSVAGGEPLLHPQIDEIVAELVKRKYFVYLCTNGLLLKQSLKKFKPAKYLAFVVHLDGTEENHDRSVGRAGVFKIAFAALEAALKAGFRVTTNTTIYRGSDVEDLHRLFRLLTAMGVEGLMVSPGYSFETASEHDRFLERQESIRVFRRIIDPRKRFRFYNNPLYLEFLRGEREYRCNAWGTPTYTPLGWRKPCYILADEHVQSIEELFADGLWERLGPGRDERCANCMMHSGFEPASVFHAFRHPRELAAMVRGVKRPKGNGHLSDAP